MIFHTPSLDEYPLWGAASSVQDPRALEVAGRHQINVLIQVSSSLTSPIPAATVEI